MSSFTKPLNRSIMGLMSYKIQCEECNIEFNSSFPNTKVCSDICRKDKNNRIWGRKVLNRDEKISSGTVGAMSELSVATDLMLKGYAVFRALSPNCYCDLMAVKDDRKYDIEVRTGYRTLTTNKISFPNAEKDKEHKKYYGVYERNEAKIYYFDENKKPIII